ncbi:hypothetical protein RKD18_005056 [Streptomyces phaeoluteigriseus]
MGERFTALSSLGVTGEACEELPSPHRFFMWRTSHNQDSATASTPARPPTAPVTTDMPTAPVTPDVAKGSGHDEGPRGTDPRGPSLSSAPASGQRRCLRSGAGGSRRWLVERPRPRRVSAGAHSRRATGLNLWRSVGTERRTAGQSRERRCNAVVPGGTWGFLRIVLDERGTRNRLTQPLRIFAFPAGRPRASPRPAVLLGDRAAVPCRPVTSLERGPTAHGTIRTPHRPSEPRVVLPGPPLAGTDIGTNEAVRGRSRAVRVRGTPNSDATPAHRTQMRPRHSSRSVIAREVPGLPRACR